MSLIRMTGGYKYTIPTHADKDKVLDREVFIIRGKLEKALRESNYGALHLISDAMRCPILLFSSDSFWLFCNKVCS